MPILAENCVATTAVARRLLGGELLVGADLPVVGSLCGSALVPVCFDPALYVQLSFLRQLCGRGVFPLLAEITQRASYCKAVHFPVLACRQTASTLNHGSAPPNGNLRQGLAVATI